MIARAIICGISVLVFSAVTRAETASRHYGAGAQKNWALQQVYQLDKTARQIFFDVLKSGKLVKPLMNQAGNPAQVDWSAVVVEALHHLGGRAEIQDIYMEIARKRPEAAVLHWKASVRDALDSNSLNFKISGVSGVDAFNVDYLFYKDRESFWQLADFGI